VIYSIDVRIEVPVRDTEATDRVDDAVRNVFPDAEPVHEDGRLVAEAHTLDAFSDVLHEQEILDTARRVFLRNSTDEGFAFSLKKQAAFEGVASRTNSARSTSTSASASPTSSRSSTTSRRRPTTAGRSTRSGSTATGSTPTRPTTERRDRTVPV